MILGEPERTQGDLNFVLFGIPVRVHPLFWLVAVLLCYGFSDLPQVLVWVVALFIAILFHELGHAVVMRAFGFRPWIVLYGMGGLAICNPNDRPGARQLGPWRQILISLAGPLAGFALAAAVAGGIILAGYREKLHFGLGGSYGIYLGVGDFDRPRLAEFINSVFFICVFWGLVNLLPVYPLDGGQIAREIFCLRDPNRGYRQSLGLSMFTAVCVAVVGALLWRSLFVALLFGYMAYFSYMLLQIDSRRGTR